MLWGENKAISVARWIPPKLLWASLAFLILANGVTLAKSISKRVAPQEIRFDEILEAEQRLADLGYWTGPIDGNLDAGSRHALIAFQKVEGRQRSGRLTANELEVLRTATRTLPRHMAFAHVEIDLGRQVLFIVDASGFIARILQVCTGNETFYVDHGQIHRANTPKGKFKVLRKVTGWRLSSLGLLYYPSYILEGIAIHGSLAVMVYPDSHGCIRVPMFAAKELSEIMPIGTEVIIYDDEDEGAVITQNMRRVCGRIHNSA